MHIEPSYRLRVRLQHSGWRFATTDGAGITWFTYAGADSPTLAYLVTGKEAAQGKPGRVVSDLGE